MSYAGYCPSGTVFAFAGSSAPSGWINCNGAEYSQTLYSELFSAIGTTYATQVNPTTGSAWASPTSGFFRVPDYRSLFLRGTGTNNLAVANTLGVWKDDATAKNNVTVTNNRVGTENDGIHSHSTNILQNQSGGSITGYEANFSNDNTTVISTNQAGSHFHYVTSNVTLQSTDTETRPQSQVVNYIIKI